MAKKKKRLPKDFRDLLTAGDLDRLKAVFDSHELDAQDGQDGPTALGMYGCPPELAVWLIAKGADPQFPQGYGNTALGRHISVGNVAMVDVLLDAGAPLDAVEGARGQPPLHQAARFLKPAVVRLLLDRGVNPLWRDHDGRTALDWAIMATRNTDIPRLADVAQILLSAGLPISDENRAGIKRIGEEFEFHRAGFNPDLLAETQAGLDRLYALFGVSPVAVRREYDGVQDITVTATDWPAQFEELWSWLVPSSGPARTVQGEVIRLAGRIRDEQYRNGGANWDAGFRKMLTALIGHLGSGAALPEADLALAHQHAASLGGGQGPEDVLDDLCRLAVAWVLLNAQPVALPKPAYPR